MAFPYVIYAEFGPSPTGTNPLPRKQDRKDPSHHRVLFECTATFADFEGKGLKVTLKNTGADRTIIFVRSVEDYGKIFADLKELRLSDIKAEYRLFKIRSVADLVTKRELRESYAPV